MKIREFKEWLDGLSPEDQEKELHCVQLHSGAKVSDLRMTHSFDNDPGTICIDADGP